MLNSKNSTGKKKSIVSESVVREAEDFSALLDESFGVKGTAEGSIVPGYIVKITSEFVFVDVGLKSEGLIPVREFMDNGKMPDIKKGDTVEIYVERYEGRDGNTSLSRDKAKRQESWTKLEKAFEDSERVEGVITLRVKGGFNVDLNGVLGFLPNSQVDVRPVKDMNALMNVPQNFVLVKIDQARGNVVVSRRLVMEESRTEQRASIIGTLHEGAVLEGIVKNITEYGAFVDLGGVDGLLHVTDMSWKRLNDPREAVDVGQPVRVKVIKFNQESGRISLGMKQLEEDPWQVVPEKYAPGTKLSGRISNIAEYGAFVEIEEGIEGLIHVSEMSWTEKNVPPSKLVSSSQEVDVIVLDIDPVKRRISLGLKQMQPNPWVEFAKSNPVGSTVQGKVKYINEFGLIVEVASGLDGLAHKNDLSWSDTTGEETLAKYTKGDSVTVKILDIDAERERIGLGIRQLQDDPASGTLGKIQKNSIVMAKVTAVNKNGIEVSVDDVLTGYIRRNDLARDRDEQRPERFSVGDEVEAKVLTIDRVMRRLSLTIKGLEIDEDKEAVSRLTATDSGASLGDILGAAIRKRNQDV